MQFRTDATDALFSVTCLRSYTYDCAYIWCGGNHEKAVERTRLNFDVLLKWYDTNLVKWSVAKLPFKDYYIDGITHMASPISKMSRTFILHNNYRSKSY